ncbi:MAG: GntR family transcriptional regulator [Thalassobaculales bacterium]
MAGRRTGTAAEARIALETEAQAGRGQPGAAWRPDRSTLQGQIYGKLKEALMIGTFKPGQPITLRGLATAVGTSPIPVREAVRHLLAERALEALPNGSVRVPLLTRRRFADLTQVRLLVEGYATELGATRLTPAELRRAETAFAGMVEALAARDNRRFLTHNQRFRFAIYAGARSDTLMPIIESLWLQVGPYFNFVFDGAQMPDSMEADGNALAAIKRQDAATARHWIETDIRETAAHLMSLLPEDGDQE